MAVNEQSIFLQKTVLCFVYGFCNIGAQLFSVSCYARGSVSVSVRNPNMSPEATARVRQMFGLDRPWYEQFFVYLKNLSKGNMGNSFIYKKPVAGIINERLMASLLLTVLAEIIAIVAGLFLGIVASMKRGKSIDIWAMGFSLITYAMPTFWLGILMITFFSVHLKMFPTSGMLSPGMVFVQGFNRWWDIGRHIFLPALTLSLVLIGEYMLIMRSTLIDILTEDYIITAEAKGMDEKSILKKHALPNAMIPMVTLISMNLGFTITGALQVETVFSWPGLGRLMYDALQARDYPLLQGIFLITGLCVVGANFISDILYGYLDPRVKG